MHRHYQLVFLLVTGLFLDAFAAPPQVPLTVSEADAEPIRPRRKLQGRFLHITDMHPDPYYRVGMSEKSACHRKKPRKAKERSGVFGMPFSDCDSPFTLTNYTLDFIEQQWASDIDFVVWTGDSARHDNDRKLPRTTKEIYDLNRAVARRMESVFTSKGIPVIPSIGNNDVWRPNEVTFEFSSIWRAFVPFPSYQVFQRGGYFSVEVIPSSLAVISLNTMYFYDSNKAVGGCEPKDPEDPGNLQLDWLEVQLKMFRSKGMQVWISGHVPPSASNYFPDCHVRYVELSLRFQDTIVGHLFGHMNADHFFFLDAQVASGNRTSDLIDPVEAQKKKKDLYGRLLQDFAHMHKGVKDIDYDNYAVVNVAPSVVPNPYLPSFRIFSYNISGRAYLAGELGGARTQEPVLKTEDRQGNTTVGATSSPCSDEGFQNSLKCKSVKRWYSSPESPSRRNTLWSPLGYAQYYLPNLTGTERRPPKYELEYMTFAPSALHTGDGKADAAKVWQPIPLRHLPKSLRNSTVSRSKYAPYMMEDLTIPSWLGLSRRLGRGQHEKLRARFKRYMYMGSSREGFVADQGDVMIV
ncbi:Metallo-dependent phosphatase-like protein [Cristinia sonorae]|uniref:Metallo-dependent phosphatase-like protein n=1 Tax=Cristinia sonorae TaxID=1940300 RepID=A0A8K0XN00_9AGAR|nr:Metallo-dependent phosphatase-like protein [Cristinia sonorae]